MVRVVYSPEDRKRMGRVGMIYSYRTVSYILGCGKSTVARHARALSNPLPIRPIGRRPRITQDNLSLTERVLAANRRTKAIDILPILQQKACRSLSPRCVELQKNWASNDMLLR